MEHPLNVHIVADALISSLGFGTNENVSAIRSYRTARPAVIDPLRLQQAAGAAGIPEGNFTRLEQLFILTIRQVTEQAGIDLRNPDCAILLSTTKGNIDLLAGHTDDTLDKRLFLGEMGQRIGRYFGAEKRTEVLSNACISGVSALIVAKRWIETGRYTDVVVAGGDLLSSFITSGFQSFKSISENLCRPYDSQRDGLNLGEACGAILLSHRGTTNDVLLTGGDISNDANHISGPSRTGDGLSIAICQAMREANVTPQEVSFINAHGTATLYNDEMESKAIHLAGLEAVPVHSLKPYFGHTLGASGVIETIISLHQLREGILFGTYGYESLGVPMPIEVSAAHRYLSMQHCIKTASGFGGCNAAIVLSLPQHRPAPATDKERTPESVSEACAKVALRQNIRLTATVTIEQSKVSIEQSRVNVDQNKVNIEPEIVFSSAETDFSRFIREAFKDLGESNMKFYKMDDLCKLGYVAAGYLLKQATTTLLPQETGIVLANASASLDTDLKHQTLIDSGGDEAASPAVFVYTLPNVVAGEICIRHKIQGENTFFIAPQYDATRLEQYARIAMADGGLKRCVVGWCELLQGNYRATFNLLETYSES